MDHYPLPKILKSPVPLITPGDILLLGNEPYISAGRGFDGYNLIHEQHPDQRIFLTHAVINEQIEAKTARLLYGGNKPEVRHLELLFNGRKFGEFGEKEQRVARLRERLFKAYDAECLTKTHVRDPVQISLTGSSGTGRRSEGQSARTRAATSSSLLSRPSTASTRSG